MGKKQAMGYPRYGKLWYGEIHLFCSKLHSLIHIIDAEMLAHQAEKMFGPSGDDDLTALLVNKSHRIPDKITPGTRTGAKQQRIVLPLLYLMDHIRFRVRYQIAVGIEILIVKWNKFQKDMLIGDQPHPFRVLEV